MGLLNESTRKLILGIVLCFAVVACGGGNSGSGAARVGNPSSSELFDRSYGYLLRGDPEFTRFAPNYANLRPFTRDTALVVKSKSEVEKLSSASADYLEHFFLHVHRPMSVRMIVADSSGQGLISYEFQNLPEGEYTIGSKGWPQPQVDLVAGNPFVYVFFVGDQRFRTRYKLGLDSKHHLTYMPQPALPG
jgi:hypothetical protein